MRKGGRDEGKGRGVLFPDVSAHSRKGWLGGAVQKGLEK